MTATGCSRWSSTTASTTPTCPLPHEPGHMASPPRSVLLLPRRLRGAHLSPLPARLMFHHFPDEADVGANCLVRSTDFTYSYEADATRRTQPDLFVPALGHPVRAISASKRQLPEALPAAARVRVHRADDQTRRFARSIPRASRTCPPVSTARHYQWVDLDGEGLSGILTEQADGWFYKRNLSANHRITDPGTSTERTAARFSPVELVASKPIATLAAGQAQFLDLAGDGQTRSRRARRAHARLLRAHRRTKRWEPFQPFASLAARRYWRDPQSQVRRPHRRRPRRHPDHRGRGLRLAPLAGRSRLRPGATRAPAARRGTGPAAGLRRRHAVDLPRRHVRRRPHRPRAHPQRRGLLLAQPRLRPLRRQGHDGQRAVVRQPRPVRPAAHPPRRHRRLRHHRHHLPRPRRRAPLLQPVRQPLERAAPPAAVPARRQPLLGHDVPTCSATAPPAWSGRRRCPATRAGRCATST